MKIIRALWGSPTYVIDEIPRSPIFSNEIVYVWGKDNQRMLEGWGYETVLVKETITDPIYSTHLKHFIHKLIAIEMAEESYEEILFLDWDISFAKEIDEKFFSLIRERGDLQCPLYAYHGTYREDVERYHTDQHSFTGHLDDFLTLHIQNLEAYHWELGSLKVLPCFCFVYSRKRKLGKELIRIAEEKNISACIEEFAFQVYCDCTLEEYIQKYEPLVLRGKERDKNLPGMSLAIQELNSHVETKLQKEIYLFHDL